MAKETKSIEVNPASENNAIEVFQTFGWELMGAPQTIHFKNTTHKDSWDGDHVIATTTTTHYVKMTFQREKSIPNYNELVELENQYYYLRGPSKSSFVCILEKYPIIWVIAWITYIIPGVLLLSWKKKHDAKYDEEYNEFTRRQNEILYKAKKLSD